MRFEVIKEKLLEAVSQAERIAGKHVSLPVLSCIVLEAKKSGLVVKATNLDIGVEIEVSAKVEEEGIVALAGGLLKAFLSSAAPAKNVTFVTVENVLKADSGTSEATFNTVSAEDFPVIPKVTDGKAFSIGSKEFLGGLRSVVWSAAVSTIKPEQSSVYIYEDQSDLVFVATDSFRLAERRIKVKKVNDFDAILIPFRNAQEIIRTFENFGGELEIIITKNQLSIVADSIHLTSRIVDGNFPDYRQIIPKEFVTEATILKQDLAQVLKLGSLFSDSFNQVTIVFDPTGKTIELTTKNNEVGESKQKIKGTIKGEAITMPFNHRYLYDCLQAIEGESLILKVAGQSRPMIITPASGTPFTYLVMSMNR